MSCESLCASLWSGLQFEAVIVLMMCTRMLWLHCIDDMSGERCSMDVLHDIEEGVCTTFSCAGLLDGWALDCRPWAVYVLD